MVSPDPSSSPPLPLPVVPSSETWRAMSAAAREQFQCDAIDALNAAPDAMSEGRPHYKAKARLVDLLGLHFRTMGRTLYLASELAVAYPEEPVFCPDLLAVLDVPETEDDARLTWVVDDEGRGLDFALEVLHHGDRRKDLVDNVQRYARLSIPEYFIYDQARQQVLGYRLSGGKEYGRIVPQLGRVRSEILGVDFSVQAGALRVFHGNGELTGTADLVRRLSGMVNDVEDRANEEAARANEEAARAEAATMQLRAALLATLERAALVATEADRARIQHQRDPAVLGRWLVRALSATQAAAIFDAE